MSSTFSRWILPVILVLVAIVGWGAYFLSSESPETGQTESAGLDQELQALQQNFAELQLDQESLLQENIALRALNESLQAEDDSGAGQASYPRLPGGREHYLAKRLQYASKQLRRLRTQKDQVDVTTQVPTDQVAMSESDPGESHESMDTVAADSTSGAMSTTVSDAGAGRELTEQLESMEVKLQDTNHQLQEISGKEDLDSTELIDTQTRLAELEEQIEAAIVVSGDAEAENQRLHLLLAEQEQAINQLLDTLSQFQTVDSISSGDSESEPIAQTETPGSESQQTVESESGADAEIKQLSQLLTEQERTIDQLLDALNQFKIVSSISTDASESEPVAQTESSDSDPQQTIESGAVTEALKQIEAAMVANRRLEEENENLREQNDDWRRQYDHRVFEVKSEAKVRIDDVESQLQTAQAEIQKLQRTLQTQNDKTDMLANELESANERTQNMEAMAQAITEENRRFGTLIDDLQNTLGMTIAEKDSQISSIRSEFAMVEYSTDILFESGSPVISEKGKLILKELVTTIEAEKFADRVINIEGHTDNVPIAGDLLTLYPTNWELSLARATSAARFLIEQGVKAERLRPVGRGESRPRAVNDTEAGRAANRRIEIHFVPELERVQN